MKQEDKKIKMENKINIAEILKDCPKGTKLYSPLCGECRVFNIYDGLGFDVICGDDTVYNFSYDGRYNIMGECCIFPSKENRDWNTFQKPFKDGDIVTYRLGGCLVAFIYKERINPTLVKSHFILYAQNMGFCKNSCIALKEEDICFATEEEKQKLFDAIKEHGYRWNAETKTLEKLIEPKFKAMDVIQNKDGYKVKITEVNIDDELYGYESVIAKGIGGISFNEQDDWELIPNKFDITSFKAFDKVLVRDDNEQKWTVDMFSFYDKKLIYPFACVGHYTNQCIPYEGNEHLCGTNDDCDDFYKNWE